MDQDTKYVQLPEPKYLNKHRWTDEEKVFKRKERILKVINDLEIPLKSVLIHKLSKSVFGSFLKELNQNQIQDSMLNENKMQILSWQLKSYNDHDKKIIDHRNSFTKGYFTLLKKAVNDCDIIDLGFLEEQLDILSLNCCFIKEVDGSLKNFKNIQILTLSGNYIKEIVGSCLPKSLKYLELFDNFISDLRNLVKHAPKTILHLGLARNRLTNESNLHLLSKSENFTHLKSLELSDNDICDLKSALESLKESTSLTAFSMEGNPCAVTPEYKNEILSCFPKLQYLDFTEILNEDRKILTRKPDKLLPQIIFRCHRILGLPEPPKDTKNAQIFYIEVNFPLFVENLNEIEEKSAKRRDEKEIKEKEIEEEEEKQKEKQDESEKRSKKSKDKKGKEKTKKEKPEKDEVKHKKGKKKSYYASANEYDEQLEKYNTWYKTERVMWSKVMEFPPLYLHAPENNLMLIRDSFRSIVPVRLIYLKLAPPSDKTQSQKNKEKPKNDKNSKKSTKEEIDTTTSKLENNTYEQQTEKVLKKVTLASFYCDLRSVNWSDETMDFYWADHADIGNKALRVNGSLKAIDYDLNMDVKKAKEKQSKSGENIGLQKPVIPNVLTCQVGFGLNRY